jgi:thiol:disulfide interchange protein DsbD
MRLHCLLFALLAAVHASFAAPPPNPLQMELVCETSSIQPGKPFLVGLLLQHPKSYHSYWMFPGIVGVPTSLKWDLPKGWKAGPLQWPTPERVWMFQIKAQGFHGKKLIPVEITPPSTLVPGSRHHLSATTSWMCCGKDCNPGYKKLEIELLASDANPSRSVEKDFAAAKASLPLPLPGWAVAAEKNGSRIAVKVEARSPEARAHFKQLDSATFFTLDGLTDPNRAEVCRRESNGFLLEIGIWEFAPSPLPQQLRGILVTPKGWLPGHPDRGLSVTLPLR